MLQCHGTARPTSTIQTMSQFPSIVSIQGWALLSSSDWCPQKSLPEGNDYCERKIKFLKANHDKLVEVCISFALFSVVDLLIKTIRKTVFFWSKSW